VFHRSPFHEWPTGIPYGNNGATLEECNGILNADAHTRSLIANVSLRCP